MPQLIVTTRTGETQTVDAPANVTAMEAIRDSGIDELLALCGGVCSCATCHIHVDPAFAGLLPAMSEDENELLDASTHRNANSRLACQIRLTESMSGLSMTIAEED